MDFMHDQFQYPPQPPRQPVYYHPGQYPPYLQHPHQVEEHYMTYGHPDYTDFVPHGPYHDDYEEVGEVATRPRLTKDQVEVLEAQFQANHKPNSTVKRQLALQTNLSLPRVANWFQNRRAKAKQQKRQEEFETNQSSRREHPRGEGSIEIKDEDEQGTDDEDTPGQNPEASATDTASSDHAAKEAGWASLQRALTAAKAAHSTQHPAPQPAMMPPPPPQPVEMIQNPGMSASYVGMSSDMAMQEQHLQTFSREHSSTGAWASHQIFQDNSFDFGFHEQHVTNAYPSSMPTHTESQNLIQDSLVLSPDTWTDGLPTPRANSHHHIEDIHTFDSPDLPLPVYPESRRGSGADSLTNNFDAFALAGDSPHTLTNPASAFRDPSPEGQLDIAARRKRPRPAALTSASLRSRSYGAMTSMSPTFRPGLTPTAHTVRHVKSTGHNLNARFSGIRKPNSAQRSPISVSTFAEAEAFNRLMAQQAAASQVAMPSSSETSRPLMSPAVIDSTHAAGDHPGNPMSHNMDLASRYQLPNTQHLTLLTASPPTTPFAPEFDPMTHANFAMPPISAPPQYATFPDYTPPYSAGPLTNSSWSDAPLTSPDLPNFPPVTYVPSIGHPHKSESISGLFSEFVLASDPKHDVDAGCNTPEQKRTDFFIQEFPNQKEEHASIAKHLAQTRPKNFVFANTAPSDYDQA